MDRKTSQNVLLVDLAEQTVFFNWKNIFKVLKNYVVVIYDILYSH